MRASECRSEVPELPASPYPCSATYRVASYNDHSAPVIPPEPAACKHEPSPLCHLAGLISSSFYALCFFVCMKREFECKANWRDHLKSKCQLSCKPEVRPPLYSLRLYCCSLAPDHPPPIYKSQLVCQTCTEIFQQPLPSSPTAPDSVSTASKAHL